MRIRIASVHGVDPTFLIKHLELLPRNLLRYIRDRGIRFVVTHNNVTEYMPGLFNYRPEGHTNYDQEHNLPLWQFRGGTYNSERKTVVIATDQR